MTVLTLVVFVLLLVTIGGVKVLLNEKGYGKESDKKSVAANADAAGQEEKTKKKETKDSKEEPREQKTELIARADRLAASYDYDAAIELVKTYSGYEKDTELKEKIAAYEETKASCVPVDIEEVTHVFYHSLVVDPVRAFGNQDTDVAQVGMNQWMTTVSEFEKITQEMYDRGYVMVSIHDTIEAATDENGNTLFKPGTIMLPPGKKAFVMSLDDLSYYHSYDGYGIASKLILDENGDPTNEYIQADGTMVTGAYDAVPLIDQFVKEHPDASYRGAKGIIALTGYNGILGYRTDISYETVPEDINADKKKWLDEHPDFNLQTERDEAKKVADAMKERGWEFASHTWGHLKVGTVSMERLQTDTRKWKENIEPLVGPTDTIIFAHGADLGDWGNYDTGNEKFQYLHGEGYNIFCNVDSNKCGPWFGGSYVRQARRNLDGYRIYYNSIGTENNLTDLFDAKTIIDPQRPPVKPLG